MRAPTEIDSKFMESGNSNQFQPVPVNYIIDNKSNISELQEKLETLQKDFKSSVNLNSLSDAIKVAEYWPIEIPIPTLDMDEDGILYFFNFDANGNSLAGLEFIAENSKVAYTILQPDHRDFDCGVLNVNSHKDLDECFFATLKERWGNSIWEWGRHYFP